jgi:hypothetical protein
LLSGDALGTLTANIKAGLARDLRAELLSSASAAAKDLKSKPSTDGIQLHVLGSCCARTHKNFSVQGSCEYSIDGESRSMLSF